jgi:hypothetical protein
MLNVALAYIDRGWNPVPVDYRTKKPRGNEWQRRRITAETAPHYFNGAASNIGVQLGAASNGLTDVDLDCAEAIAVAPYILPRTAAIFGRKSKRFSHFLYVTTLASTMDTAAVALNDPRRQGANARLVELRIGAEGHGAHTVLPPSEHKDPPHEIIQWEENGDPTTVDGDDLHKRVRVVAAYALLARYWPPETSGHHDAARVVGGFLARLGLDPPVLRCHVESISRAAGSARWKELCRTAEDAAKAYRDGKRTFGVPELAKTFGQDIAEKVARMV